MPSHRLHYPLLSSLLVLAATPAVAVSPAGGDGNPALNNPQMSLIINGIAYTDDAQGSGNEWIGEAAGIANGHGGGHGDEHGAVGEGFNLSEAEVVLSATVDDKFDGYANIAFSPESVVMEEIYFTTRALPAGWQLKGGKFFSAFGYTNAKHPHSWDFADQNLAYASLVGDEGLNDTGVQVTFSPATDTWMQFGLEALQGHEQEKFGGTEVDLEELAAEIAEAAGDLDPLTVGDGSLMPNDYDTGTRTLPTADNGEFPDIARRGPQVYTGFFKFAPDLGTDHAVQFGLNYALHKSQQEAHEELDANDNLEAAFYAHGEATLVGLEAVYKRAATGRYGKGALRVQAEWLKLEKDLNVVYHTDSAQTGAPLTGEQDAFYLQGTWGFAANWSAGLRWDATAMNAEFTEGGVTTALDESSRLSAALTWRPSEYTAWRLQVSDADITDESGANETFTQVFLQFNMSLGAHGAHTF